MTEQFDITKAVLRADRPKPKAKIDPIFADLDQWSARAIREHYPERVHELIKDE